MYSEAVIAYNSKQPAEALKILDALLKLKPDYVQALELKALVLKSSGKPEQSRATYEALIRSTPRPKAGPYHFELGVIEYNARHLEKAEAHFQESLARGFNADTSHFFLGLIDFNLADKPGRLAQSQRHFNAVAEGGTAELKPPAHYYLGLIAYKTGSGSEGTFELIEARSVARSMPDNAIAKDIEKAVNTALAPYGKGQWFGNASVLGAYNTNVSTLPNSATAPEQVSGKATPQLLLVAGLGRMSSPLNRVQWVASYRGTFNLNFNSAAKGFEFLTHTGDLYFTLNPLARTQWGLKLEGSFNFQNQADEDDPASYTFRKYSLSGELGPYMRREIARATQLSVEAYFRPSKYYDTPDESANGWSVRGTLARDTGDFWFNPTASLSLDRNPASSEVFNDWGVSLGLTDTLHVTSKDVLNAVFSLTANNYLQGATKRYDQLFTFRLNEIHHLTDNLTAVVDLSEQVNQSTQDTLYSYNQLVASAGLGYSF
jgi:tetratricopeptide (TPR) repeat protein